MTIEIQLSNYTKLETHKLPTSILNIIKQDLTFDNPEYKNALKYGKYVHNIPKKKYTYIMTKFLYLPKAYIDDLIFFLEDSNLPYVIEDKRIIGCPCNFSFVGTLKPYQMKALDKLLKYDMGTLEAPCGSGKTTIALNVIAKRNRSTLILVHTKDLLDQWKERIHDFLDIPMNEIGEIGGGKFKVKPITIGMIQTLSRMNKEKIDPLNTYFGQIIQDEAHHQPANTFVKAITNFSCKYQLGLSATPYRSDGLTKLIQLYMGKISATITNNDLCEAGAKIHPVIKTINTNFTYEIDEEVETFDYVLLIDQLIADKDRNELIMKNLCEEAYKGHFILVLSTRVLHSKFLNAYMQLLGYSSEYLDSQSSSRERKDIIQKMNIGKINAIFSTTQLAGEGLDIPRLDRLFLITPVKFKGKVIQFIGRICRVYDKKVNAIVYDYVDVNVKPCLGMYISRLKNVYYEFKVK